MRTSTTVLLCCLLSISVSARPQDSYGSGGASSASSSSSGAAAPAPAPAAPSGGITSTSFVAAPAVQASYQVSSGSSSSGAAAPAPAAPAPSSSGSSSLPSTSSYQEGGPGGSSASSSPSPSAGGSSSSGGGLSTDCQRQEVGDGKFKFVCGGVNPESISLRSEHILWLTQDGGQSQVVDIEVPNYKINELIKAGFKPGSAGDQTINVLLKKPEQTVDAQVDKPTSAASKPNVKLSYEPVTKQLIHFPNDKQYSPLSGPILPPLAGGAGGRAQRQVNSYQQQQQQQVPPGFQVQPQLTQRFIHQFDQPIYSAASYATGRN